MCKSQILLKTRHLTTAPQSLCGCIVPELQTIPFGDLDWGTDGYEDQNTSGMLGFQANTYMVYNMAKIDGSWIDFNGGPGGSSSNAIPVGRFAMIAMVFTKDGCTFYVDGKKVEYGPSNSSADVFYFISGHIWRTFPTISLHFYGGKSTFTGTFRGQG